MVSIWLFDGSMYVLCTLTPRAGVNREINSNNFNFFFFFFPGLSRHNGVGGIVDDITGMGKTSLHTSSRTLFVRDSLAQGGCPRHVERNYVPLFGVTQSNVELRNYVHCSA